MSPCIKVCSLDERGLCRGCHRTLDEIAAWPRLSRDQRGELLVLLARRAAANVPGASLNSSGDQ